MTTTIIQCSNQYVCNSGQFMIYLVLSFPTKFKNTTTYSYNESIPNKSQFMTNVQVKKLIKFLFNLITLPEGSPTLCIIQSLAWPTPTYHSPCSKTRELLQHKIRLSWYMNSRFKLIRRSGDPPIIIMGIRILVSLYDYMSTATCYPKH